MKIFVFYLHIVYFGGWCKLVVEFHLFACSCPYLTTPFVEEAIFTLFYASAHFVKYYLIIKAWVNFWALYSVPLAYVPVFMPLPGSPASLLLEENIGRKISDISHSNTFTDMSPRARDIKERINKWTFIKNKKFLHG